MGAIGSNAIFCEFYDLIVPQAPIFARPEELITGENFVAIGQGKITFKVIEKLQYGLLKTVSKHLSRAS